jgi:cytoskeletal protein CcmA (bactofilin family)
MAFDLGLRNKSEPATPVAKPAGSAGTTYFDESSEFSGTLRLQSSACIDGSVEGEIDCDRDVTVGPSGRVHAQIHAQSIVILGEVRGDIHARSEITLHKTARVHGDMTTEGIVIEKGAKVEGRITIGSQPELPPIAATQAASLPAQVPAAKKTQD